MQLRRCGEVAASAARVPVVLRQIDRAYQGQELHLDMDNYATHKTAEVRQRLESHPRLHVHFTPASGSWLTLVEVWFGIIDRQANK
ncbi:transposase [Brevibacterium atlanticum]|uniref:transposase n=1 Tax=Brevibacterium atlanticum TaxID=2697563 RepID=UPI0038995AFF